MIDISQSNNQIELVTNIQDLVSKAFHGNINAIGYQRKLQGDFHEIIKKVELTGNMVELNYEELMGFNLSEEGQIARGVILDDLKLLKNQGAAPVLNVIKNYEKDDAFPFFPTDVYSFHVDSSPVPTSTFLCTYHGEPSDIIPNSQAIKKVLIPEIRKELLKLHGEGEEGFEAFLSEFFFDLHYQAKPKAKPISLGVGHIWRLAVDFPKSKVLPCIHRAPIEESGRSRLMLIC
jgi:hypothetical protein